MSQVEAILDPNAEDTQPEPASSVPEDTSYKTTPNEPPAVQPTSAPAPPPGESSHTAPTQPSEPESTPEPSPGTDINSLFPDRAARLEADYQLTQEAEAAARAAKAAGKRKAVDAEIASSPGGAAKDPKKLSYAAQEKLRKQAHQSELARILQRVEADKRERKEREEARRKQREHELRETSGAEFASAAAAAPPSPPAATAHDDMAMKKRLSISAASGSRGPAPQSGDVCLRIRLLDGSQIREYFAPGATLAADVRPRVDWALGGDRASAPPYSFKHILAPLPNRTLGPAEEARPLGELPDVVPSATMVLVPVKGGVVAAAYARAAGGGLAGRVWVAVMQVWGLVVGFLAALFGRGGGSATAAGGHRDGGGGGGGVGERERGKGSGRGAGAGEGASGIRIRTLRDQGEGEGEGRNEFYNGNSLDFEPKGEDGDEAGK